MCGWNLKRDEAGGFGTEKQTDMISSQIRIFNVHSELAHFQMHRISFRNININSKATQNELRFGLIHDAAHNSVLLRKLIAAHKPFLCLRQLTFKIALVELG